MFSFRKKWIQVDSCPNSLSISRENFPSSSKLATPELLYDVEWPCDRALVTPVPGISFLVLCYKTASMPEGPSLVILKDEIRSFIGAKIIDARVNSKNIADEDIIGKKIVAIKTWGKHLLICLPQFTIRIHLLMFGSYRINEEKENSTPRLQLFFSKKRSLAFYACSVRRIDGPLDDLYDWEADVMNVHWNSSKALSKLKQIPDAFVCDALLDQQIFSGVGNIIKNEVLFRIRVHPLSRVGALPAKTKTTCDGGSQLQLSIS